ncbi:WXG100 family type VII secretion target [Nocardia sp. NPDC049220]|uniref:WXG100 family type VII secretion target n=1 Tax=Nocardia sp. NPDC049220 TaxID=3155273 RepID=UPI0033DA1AAD
MPWRRCIHSEYKRFRKVKAMALTNLGGDGGAGTGEYGVEATGIDGVKNRMTEAISTLKTSINQIDDSVQAVAAGWQGDAHSEFVTKAADWHDEVARLNVKLDAFSTAVDEGKKTIVNTDQAGLA